MDRVTLTDKDAPGLFINGTPIKKWKQKRSVIEGDNLVALDKAMEKVQFEWVSLEGDE